MASTMGCSSDNSRESATKDSASGPAFSLSEAMA